MSAGRCQATILVDGVRHVCGRTDDHKLHSWSLVGGVTVQSPYPVNAPRTVPQKAPR